MDSRAGPSRGQARSRQAVPSYTAEVVPFCSAIDNKYVLGWSTDPAEARTDNPDPDRSQLLIWHGNYHPDGGQLFYPLDNRPFVTAVARAGDDMRPEDWVAFYCDGSFGICLHAGIWHEAIVPLSPLARFYDKQGAVHARISAHFPKEFGVLLSIPLPQRLWP